MGNMESILNTLQPTGTMHTKQDFILKIAKSVLLNAINDVCIYKFVTYDKEHHYDRLQTLSESRSFAGELESIENLFQYLIRWNISIKKTNFREESSILLPYINFMKWLNQPHDDLEVEVNSGEKVIIALDTEFRQQAFMEFVKLHVTINLIIDTLIFTGP
ncbi:hypothetical protein [Anaerotignum propionicum]|uniref:hypothetical protein n=1 Tax=Anaerotignum propionicum TaxID=28446 RepID=UPI00210AF4A3|nr:hypothetical protein [Anaerotignum propionicum]MCQ4936339.1 hypothetical protein [Anaerotignum propionicum]